jgi:hypothetical protein
MRLTRHSSLSLVLATALGTTLGLVGCGSSNKPATEKDLRLTQLLDVGELLRMYQLEKGQPPKSFTEVEALESLQMTSPMSFERIRSGDIVVCWGATLPDTGEEPGTTSETDVLAYVKEAPEQGGPVLLLNRTVRQMNADEFKAAPKAGTPAPAATAP